MGETFQSGETSFSLQIRAIHTQALSQQKQMSRGMQNLLESINVSVVETTFNHYMLSLVNSNSKHVKFNPIEFSSFFPIQISSFAGNSDQVGQLSCKYSRGKIAAFCKEKLRLRIHAEKSNFPWFMQKPQNDLELFEWTKDFLKTEQFKGLSTKNEDFATGFALVNKNAYGAAPFVDERSKRDWFREKMYSSARDRELKEMYVFVPQGTSTEYFTEGGITVYFIPTPSLDEIQTRIEDNSGLFRSKTDDLLPINDAPQDTQSEMMSNVVLDGSSRFDLDQQTEDTVSEIFSLIKTGIDPVPLNGYFDTLGSQQGIRYNFQNLRYSQW